MINMEKVGQINCYHCDDCKANIGTINLHTGTTPFGIQCPHCKGINCHSSFYNIRAIGKLTIGECFYRPVPSDFVKLDKYSKKHVLIGGLLHAPIGTVHIIPDNVTDEWTLDQFKAFTLELYGEVCNT